MATTRPRVDTVTAVFPLSLIINGKNYRVLTKATDVKFIADNAQEVREELKAKFPANPPNEPIYIEVINGKIVVPQAMFLSDKQKPWSSDETLSTSKQCTSATTNSTSSTADEIEYFDDECMTSNNARFDWKVSTTRELLNILTKRKKVSTKDFALTKTTWPETAKEIRTKVTGSYPSPIQCREKFYSLKRGYRKYLAETKKTGNKRPRPFYFEDEMQFLLEDDPTFKPLILRSSLGTNEVNTNIEDQDTDNESEKSGGSSSSAICSTQNGKKSKRCKTDELKEYFAERDEKFMAFMREMSDKNNSVLEKLIEKL